MITLPPEIEGELSKLLKASDTTNWLKSAVSLSVKYRGEREIEGIDYIKDLNDVLGYLALRVPSTYSQIYGALSSVQELNPGWKPSSVLDIGSGPGTAVWAALEVFPKVLDAVCIEKDKNFVEIGKTIFQSLSDITVDWQTTNLTSSLPRVNKGYDLVVLANVLNEMDERTREKTIQFAYNHCTGVLVIIEPGTPDGFESIKQVSKQLNFYQTTLIAPYIENSFINSEEINFIQKIKRPEFQKRVRQLQRKNQQPERLNLLPPSDWEESKYFYLAYSKFKPEISPMGRLIARPKLFKPFVELKVLTKDGIKIEKVFKKDRIKYKQAKKLKWGDIILTLD